MAPEGGMPSVLDDGSQQSRSPMHTRKAILMDVEEEKKKKKKKKKKVVDGGEGANGEMKKKKKKKKKGGDDDDDDDEGTGHTSLHALVSKNSTQ